jgi:hypothetical protein
MSRQQVNQSSTPQIPPALDQQAIQSATPEARSELDSLDEQASPDRQRQLRAPQLRFVDPFNEDSTWVFATLKEKQGAFLRGHLERERH